MLLMMQPLLELVLLLPKVWSFRTMEKICNILKIYLISLDIEDVLDIPSVNSYLDFEELRKQYGLNIQSYVC